MSPGKMMSLTPTLSTAMPISAKRSPTRSATIRSITDLSSSNASSVRVPTAARRPNWISLYR